MAQQICILNVCFLKNLVLFATNINTSFHIHSHALEINKDRKYVKKNCFCLKQGDTTHKWNEKCFRMYVGGSVWQPPSLNPFGSQVVSTGMTASAALASASTANVQGNPLKAGSESGGATDSLTAKKNMLLKHLLKEEQDKEDSSKSIAKEKKSLSDRYVVCSL